MLKPLILLTLCLADANSDRAFDIGRELRCPVCQGMPIAESPSPMAQDMMKRVRELLAEGKSKEEVEDYFTERYGEWVVLRPATAGFSLWVWLLPPALLVAGLAWAVTYMQRLRRAATPGPTPSAGAPSDPVLQAIRDEVMR